MRYQWCAGVHCVNDSQQNGYCNECAAMVCANRKLVAAELCRRTVLPRTVCRYIASCLSNNDAYVLRLPQTRERTISLSGTIRFVGGQTFPCTVSTTFYDVPVPSHRKQCEALAFLSRDLYHAERGLRRHVSNRVRRPVCARDRARRKYSTARKFV
jgi:hypothetical protein